MTPVIHLVDDDASYLQAVTRLLRAHGFVVRAFHSAEDFLAQRDTAEHGCVVADLRMPGMDGLEMQCALARSRGPLPVIFLTGRADIPSTVHAMRNGAEDFLEKDAPKARLLDAVQRAVERDLRDREIRATRMDSLDRFAKLSERENEVLSHVLRGALNKEIADALGIGERTVKLHRTSITTKLGVKSVAEIAALAQVAGTFPKGQ